MALRPDGGPRVAVIGAGINGLCTAVALAERGCEVLLCERQAEVRGASWAGAGALLPIEPWEWPEPGMPLLRRSQALHRDLAQALHEATGIDPEWTCSGALFADPEQASALCAWAGRHGEPLEALEAEALRAQEPGLRATSALRLPRAAQVRNPRLLQALRRRAEQLGVTFLSGCEVGDIPRGRFAGFSTSRGWVTAQMVVITTGAWSAAMLGGGAGWLAPVKGQMLLLRGPPGRLHHIIIGEQVYLVPRRDGRVLVGSTLEHAGFDTRITETARKALVQAAIRLVPEIAALPVEAQWAGLRPATPSGLPYVGPVPGAPGVFVNTGHFRLGLTLAPASAELLVDLVLGRTPTVDPAPFRPPDPAS